MADDAQLRSLIKAAPNSLKNLLSLLYEGLGWPLYDATLEPEDVIIDWSPEELHLDPDHVARLSRITQIPPLTAKQKFGTFYLQFEGGQLPIGAVRRLVQRLVTSKRGKTGGKTPTWQLSDILFFCLADGEESVVHIVNFQERNGKRLLRVLTWNGNPTETRLRLLAQRTLSELTWVDNQGPRLIVEPDQLSGLAAYREGIRSAKGLSKRMAEVAQDVRDEVKSLLAVETESGPMKSLFRDVKDRLIGDITESRFADVYAQTMVYGLLTARIAHPDDFKAERSLAVMKFDNEFLDAIYSRFRGEAEGVLDIDELGLADLAEQLATTNIDELLADFGADNHRDDPVVYFYEEFLAQYDPDQRRDLGAFYTPKPVVRYIVKVVDDALKSFGLPLGVADPTSWADYVKAHPDIEIPANASPSDAVVSMFDPANGTGTFLVEWLERAKKNAGQEAIETALRHASAVEISLASYAVSHLKVSLDLPPELREKFRLPIFLGDTLGIRRIRGLEGLDDPIGHEGLLANQVKYDRHHTALIGNPPYDRDASSKAGYITAPVQTGKRSLFDDILDDAKANVIFSHTKSLNDLYVYFWRWAIWKVMEENEGPAVISMITSSSWLVGPGFLGLRRLAREVADEITVLDLGGAGRGARKEENIFEIQTPVAIVTLTRRGKVDRATPASARYHRIHGTTKEKLAAIASLTNADAGEWTALKSEWFAPLAPPTGHASWLDWPAVADLFPWQQPGCQFGRTSPVAPTKEVLERRWERFVSTKDAADRAECFNASSTGRNVNTKVAGLRKLVDEVVGASHPPIVRYGYRSFDRQWAFDDPRWAKTESPSLWWSMTPRQIFMAAMMTNKLGAGPAATLSTGVPDFHYFAGRGGKDVIPLYRDANSTPNADSASLAKITATHQEIGDAPEVTVERLFAYTFAVLAGTDYASRWQDELETPGPRLPLTADPGLFADVADLGERLIALQTFGERFASGTIDLGGVEWMIEPSHLPATKAELAYDAKDGVLHVGDGRLVGVPSDVYHFAVSGMEVIPKWLGYRTAKASGRAASSGSPLDGIRPTTWPPDWSRELREIVAAIRGTLALRPDGIALLERVLAGPLIAASALPQPPAWMRQPPKVKDDDTDTLLGIGEI
jgi:Type ISP C-terminal specificity domain